MRETWGSNTLDFFYDAMGTAYAVKYNGTLYYYITNLQGDVLHITNSSGTTVVSYTYDPYGKPLSTTGSLASTLGADNPLRYRSYYYDIDSGLYYLQSRYYDPELCRFINADSYASTGQGILGCNMFAYCGNNPVSRNDSTGFGWREFWGDVRDWLSEEKEKAATSEDITATIGITLNGAFGVAASGTGGITFDSKGNIGLAFTINGGGGFPSAGIGGYLTFSDAPNIYKQNDLGAAVGASAGPGVVAIGAEYCMMFDTEEDAMYDGVTFSATVGLYPTIVEVHGEVGHTEVKGFNIFDALIGAVDLLRGA